MAKKPIIDPENPDAITDWMNEEMRTFPSGATRDNDLEKPDYAGYLSPEVIIRFGQYMQKHSIQKDGTRRASDNWKRGIPKDVYIKSMFRHFIDVWSYHESAATADEWDEAEFQDNIEESLCAMMFNVMGYLYEVLK